MKKTMLAFAGLLLASTSAFAEQVDDAQNDTVQVTSLDDIISAETNLKSKKDVDDHYKKVWGRNGWFNISYNTTKISADNFPTADGVYPAEYENKFGLGIQSGHSYQFHKKPIGNVLFIGLDYSWLDLNANSYESVTPVPQAYDMGKKEPYSMPWYVKKWTFDYGMSLGPSLTFYPFTSINKRATDNIRLQLYFHVGYSVSGIVFDKVQTPKGKEEKTQMAWGHGMFTSFGANLTWRSIGLGYEVRKNSKGKFKLLNDDFESPEDVELEQTTNRIYIQFRY